MTHHSRDEASERPEWPQQALEWCLREGRVAIGWDSGDLRQYRSPQDITQTVKRAHPGLHNVPYSGKQLWAFLHDMQVGDFVILSTGTYRATMQVTGEYEYVPAGDAQGHYQHQRMAKAVLLPPKQLWKNAGGRGVGWAVYWALVKCAKGVDASGNAA